MLLRSSLTTCWASCRAKTVTQSEGVSRGLQGRIVQGLPGGGICYGYDLVPGETGTRRINASEANVVKRIFRDYSAGLSPRAIARRLNQEDIAGPSGGPWRDTTIRGHFGRGTGISNNELYVGRLVWNRVTYRKDPTTGRRRWRHNPTEKWIVQEVPALRILDGVLPKKCVRALFEQATAWPMHGPPAFGSADDHAAC
jgi:site-specific DNA recombinase